MDKPVAAPAVGAKEKIDKQARQLAYDTRYKVKQSMKAKAGGRIDPAAMRKAFISQLAKSPAAPAIKARAKQMLMGEGYIDVKDLIKGHTASALFKVFVEHHQKDKDGNTIPHEDEEITEAKDEKTFKVRVTDKKTGNSYVRMASRSKIADLRSNPNISSVEMTGYGEPTKSEKYKGKSTAKAKQGLDPVGKEDGDVDNDGDKDSSDKYLMKRRKAIGKAIAASEDKVWTDFKGLVEKKQTEEKKITGEGVNNKKLIKVFPDEVREEMEKKEEPKEDQGLKQKQRKANMAKKQVLMKKMQAVRMGAGDQIQASHEPEGENVIETDLNYGRKKGMTEAEYEAKAREAANESERRRKQKDNAARVRRSEMGAARRRENRNYLRSIGKYKGPMEGVEMKPEDKTPEGMGDITFDAGGAIPTTIKAIGDPRELETAMKLKKTQLRASGLNMSHEPEGDMVEAKVDKGMIFGKSLARNERKFGKKGSTTPQGYFGQKPSQAAELSKKRTDEHKAKRGVKTKGMGEAYTVTQSDKTGNTKAYQDMKAGKKNQLTGEPLYKKADHMKENLVTISNINVKPSFYNDEKNAINDILKKNSNLGEEGYDHLRDRGMVKPAKDKKDGTSYPPSAEMKKTQKVNTGPSAAEIVKKKYGKAVMDMSKK